MPLFNVTVSRTVTKESVFSIEADTPEAAEDQALVEAADFDYTQLSGEGVDYQIEDCEEAD